MWVLESPPVSRVVFLCGKPLDDFHKSSRESLGVGFASAVRKAMGTSPGGSMWALREVLGTSSAGSTRAVREALGTSSAGST